MKKLNFQVLPLMLLALLFADVVPASETVDSKKREGLFCFLILCEGPPANPTPPSTPLAKKPAPASTTSAEKR